MKEYTIDINKDWDLLVKYANKETSAVENDLIEGWMGQDTGNKKVIQEIQEIDSALEMSILMDKFDDKSAFEKITHKMQNNPGRTTLIKKTNRNRLIRIAASVLILLSIGILISQIVTDSSRFAIETGNSKPEPQKITLPDGSTVVLNTNAKISYPEQFDDDTRKVKLEGEGYFDIVPQQGKPFYVETEFIRISVKGTSFIVNSSKKNTVSEVIVNTGIVEMERKDKLAFLNRKTVELHAGKKGIFHHHIKDLLEEDNLDLNVFSWGTGNLYFRQTPFYEVAIALENTYKVNISFGDYKMQNLNFSATFKSESLETVLRVIEKSLSLKALKDGSDITFIKEEKRFSE